MHKIYFYRDKNGKEPVVDTPQGKSKKQSESLQT